MGEQEKMKPETKQKMVRKVILHEFDLDLHQVKLKHPKFLCSLLRLWSERNDRSGLETGTAREDETRDKVEEDEKGDPT